MQFSHWLRYVDEYLPYLTQWRIQGGAQGHVPPPPLPIFFLIVLKLTPPPLPPLSEFAAGSIFNFFFSS